MCHIFEACDADNVQITNYAIVSTYAYYNIEHPEARAIGLLSICPKQQKGNREEDK